MGDKTKTGNVGLNFFKAIIGEMADTNQCMINNPSELMETVMGGAQM